MRYILLNPGERRFPGDEMASGAETWYRPCEDTWRLYDLGLVKSSVRRRVDADLEPLLETIFKLQEGRLAT